MSFIQDTMFVNCKHTHVWANSTWSRGPDRIQSSGLSTLLWGLTEGRRKNRGEEHNSRGALFIVMMCHKLWRMDSALYMKSQDERRWVDGGAWAPLELGGPEFKSQSYYSQALGNWEWSTHSCRPQIFIEDLLSAKHCSGHSGHSVNKTV